MQLTIKGTYSIELENGYAINPKIIFLLREIYQTGSLNAAVHNIGISYSYAWNLLNKTSKQLNTPLVLSKKGGNGGGKAELTDTGIQLINYCEKIEADLDLLVGTHQMEIG